MGQYAEQKLAHAEINVFSPGAGPISVTVAYANNPSYLKLYRVSYTIASVYSGPYRDATLTEFTMGESVTDVATRYLQFAEARLHKLNELNEMYHLEYADQPLTE